MVVVFGGSFSKFDIRLSLFTVDYLKIYLLSRLPLTEIEQTKKNKQKYPNRLREKLVQ